MLSEKEKKRLKKLAVDVFPAARIYLSRNGDDAT